MPGRFEIPLSRPDIRDEDRQAVDQVLRSDWLSRGPAQADFEFALSEVLNASYAVAVSSGTEALTLILTALGIGAGDEVITTPFTVPATVNAIHQAGAIPVLVDIDTQTMALDPEQVQQAITDTTKALMPVHPFGLPAPIAQMVELAKQHGLHLIEDSCEALGTRMGDRSLGTFGTAGALGFYPNKQITTGEGGAVICGDPALAMRIRSLANHGRGGDDWLDQHEMGMNARLSDVACALGASQVRRLEQTVDLRQRWMDHYRQRLAEIEGVTGPPEAQTGIRVSWFACPVLLPPGTETRQRDRLVAAMADQGIQCGRYFAPLNRQPAWTSRFGETPMPRCEEVASRILILPLYNQLNESLIERVVDSLAKALKAL